MISGLRRIKARVGRKPDADRQLARSVDTEDLPRGPWQRTDQRTWRTGVSTAGEPWATAARAAGSITTWRAFAAADENRSLWVQIVPLARIEDGQAALAAVARSQGRSLRAKVSVVGSSEVLPTPSVPGATLVFAAEQQTREPAATGAALALRFVVGTNLVVMNASSRSGTTAWTWPDLLALAAVQAQRCTA